MSIFAAIRRVFNAYAWPSGSEHSGIPRVNSLVRFAPQNDYEYPKTGFYAEEVYVYLGEIVNMPGHGIFVGRRTQKVYFGYHIEDFEEISDEEV